MGGESGDGFDGGGEVSAGVGSGVGGEVGVGVGFWCVC